MPLSRFSEYLEAVKFQHTLFALPFALAAMFAASGGRPGWRLAGLVMLAMVAARTCAMAWNRVADAGLDARNPRTSGRAVPAGRIRKASMAILAIGAAAVFVGACAWLNALALALSPVALVLLLGYSYTKRFTVFSHFFLGMALACAPVGAWVAARAEIGGPALALAGFVTLWTAGFDVLYACQDVDFDRAENLRSIPAAIGIPGALIVSALCHLSAVGFLPLFIRAANLGTLSWIAAAAVTALLALEHALVRPGNLKRLETAFFQVNGAASVAFGILACADAWKAA